MSYSAYQKTNETIDDKQELLLKTYEEILSKLNIAAMAVEENDVSAKAEAISKASDALAVLKASIDFETGGEIANNLDALYAFCIDTLVKASANSDKKAIEDVRDIVNDIYTGFKGAHESLQASVAAQ